MKVEYLNDADETNVHRHSSINQYKGFLSVKKGGVNVPLRFDSLDWINCEGIETHPVIVSGGDDIGFNYPIGHYTYFTDTYIIMDRNKVIAKKLPAWYGQGWYEKSMRDKVFTNFDDRSLGMRNRTELYIGLDYVKADEMLDSADEE